MIIIVGVDNYNHVRKCTEQHTLKSYMYIPKTVTEFCSEAFKSSLHSRLGF
jgi:hypothetical protein